MKRPKTIWLEGVGRLATKVVLTVTEGHKDSGDLTGDDRRQLVAAVLLAAKSLLCAEFGERGRRPFSPELEGVKVPAVFSDLQKQIGDALIALGLPVDHPN